MSDRATNAWAMTIRHSWQVLMSSFWFIPAAIVLLLVLLAVGLISIDALIEVRFVDDWPLLFGAGAEGSRGLLTAVASSMITVAGVVFSITIVALAQTSTQYTSRVLRNFMQDRVNQVVLGVFLGIFAYCLVVVRTIRGQDEGDFVPAMAVMGGLLLAFVGIAYLIYFIHHVAMSLQAANVIAAVAQETLHSIEQALPDEIRAGPEPPPSEVADVGWTAVPARRTGYVESVSLSSLLEWAHEQEVVVRMERGIGDFVVESTPLVSVRGVEQVSTEATAQLNSAFLISRQRTVQEDPGFGVRQLVDIAMKALSPGINDTTTAVMCVDYLTVILVQLVNREIPRTLRREEGTLRLIARVPSFESLLAEAFDQIRQNGSGNVAILSRLLESVETIAGAAVALRRKRSLLRQADLVAALAKHSLAPHDCGGINATMSRLSRILDEPIPTPSAS